jgi:hypothetical protein
MMRAISSADFVSSPSEAELSVSVTSERNSSGPLEADFEDWAGSSIVRLAIKNVLLQGAAFLV